MLLITGLQPERGCSTLSIGHCPMLLKIRLTAFILAINNPIKNTNAKHEFLIMTFLKTRKGIINSIPFLD